MSERAFGKITHKKAFKKLQRACRYGCLKRKVLARKLISSDLRPMDAWNEFKETVSRSK